MKKICLIIAALALTVGATAQNVQRPSRGTTVTRDRQRTVTRDKTTDLSSEKKVTSTTNVSRKDAINEGFESIQNKDRKDALTKTALQDEKLPDIIVNNSGEAFILETKTTKINDAGGAELFAADVSAIYPGSIVFANEDLANGSPDPVGLPYGTVDLRIDYNNGGNTFKNGVRNDAASVQQAIYELLGANKAGYVQPANFDSNTSSYTSTSKMAFDLGVDAKFLGATVKVDTKTTNSESKIVDVQNFTQKYYTVSVTPNADKSTYFGDKVTWDQIEKKVKANGPLAIINTVTYGRRAYVFSEYKTADFTFTGKESGSYSGVSATAAQDIAESSKSSKEWMYMMGGSASSAASVLGGKKIKEALAKEAELKIGPSNQGVPICFTATFLASGRKLIAKATGSYTETSYVKCPKMVRWEIQNRANTAGDCIKFKALYNVIYVMGNSKDGYTFEKVMGGGSGEDYYADYIENKYSNNTKKTRTMPTKDIEKRKVKGKNVVMDNCYIYGNVYYTIRSKTADVKGVKWHEDEAGYFDVSGGSVNVYMNGSALAGGKGVYIHSDTKPKPINKN